jgi:hypothetical protein
VSHTVVFTFCLLRSMAGHTDTEVTLEMGLRIFLEAFSLPGEAQVIARILEIFAEMFYKSW